MAPTSAMSVFHVDDSDVVVARTKVIGQVASDKTLATSDQRFHTQ
jgi:hypothetical protein